MMKMLTRIFIYASGVLYGSIIGVNFSRDAADSALNPSPWSASLVARAGFGM
jgi:hypothetical protein